MRGHELPIRDDGCLRTSKGGKTGNVEFDLQDPILLHLMYGLDFLITQDAAIAGTDGNSGLPVVHADFIDEEENLN